MQNNYRIMYFEQNPFDCDQIASQLQTIKMNVLNTGTTINQLITLVYRIHFLKFNELFSFQFYILHILKISIDF